MRKDGMNDFYEVNFLRLREKDNTYPAPEIKYNKLAGIYSFISFDDVKIEKGKELSDDELNDTDSEIQIQGSATNRLREILASEIENIPLSERNTNPNIPDDIIDLRHPARPVQRNFLKASLIHKETVYNKLLQKYAKIKKKANHQKLTLFGISLRLGKKTEGKARHIVDDLRIMNRALNFMISKIRYRAMYKRIAGYQRIAIIDESFLPCAHVLFYIRDGVINESFIQELILTWCSFIPAEHNCYAGIYSFDFNFTMGLQKNLIENKINTYRAKDTEGHSSDKQVHIFINDILVPFPDASVYGYDFTQTFSLPGELTRKITRKDSENKSSQTSNPGKKMHTKEYGKIKNTPAEHKDFLLRIAKKANKIPLIRTVD